MTREQKTQWVAALQSGEYQQGHSALESSGRYCCLGVLCLVLGTTPESLYATSHNRAQLYMKLRRLARLPMKQIIRYMTMNDQERRTFPAIAAWIETHQSCDKSGS